MRRLTLFDIDGTLSNNILEHNRAFSEAFRKVYHIDAGIDSINHEGMLDQVIIMEVLKRKGLAEEEIWLKIWITDLTLDVLAPEFCLRLV